MTSKSFYYRLLDGTTSLPISGDNSADVSAYIIAATSPVTGATVSVDYESEGFYRVDVDNIPEDDGITVISWDGVADYQFDPQFIPFDKNDVQVRTIDDIYGQISAQSATIVNISRNNKYAATSINVKDRSDVLHTIRLNQDVTGWTGWDVKAYPAARLLDSDVPALSGTYDVVVDDLATGTITVVIEKDVLNGVVPDGVASTKVYADVDVIDADGYNRTVLELTMNVKRDFNQ
jgi:hypothetical protein